MSEDEKDTLNTAVKEETLLQLFAHSSGSRLNLGKYETQGKLGLTRSE